MVNSFFYSFITTEYECDYNCSDFGCDEEGICRCMSIVNPKVKSVDVVRMSNHIYSKMVGRGTRSDKLSDLLYGGSLIDTYCINRILTKFKIWKSSNWRFVISPSYYGEEIVDIKMKDQFFNELVSEVENLVSIDDLSEKIKCVLKFEYGYLTDELGYGQFELIEINKSEVEWINEKNLDLISKKGLNHYRKYELPRGVVKKIGDRYHIIDGQHRIYSSPTEKFKVFKLV
jgi:hypothetical protein